MRRAKLILPANGKSGSEAQLVDADTGEPVTCIRNMQLNMPLHGPMAVTVEVLVAEIQVSVATDEFPKSLPRESATREVPSWMVQRNIRMVAMAIRGGISPSEVCSVVSLLVDSRNCPSLPEQIHSSISLVLGKLERYELAAQWENPSDVTAISHLLFDVHRSLRIWRKGFRGNQNR